YRAHLAGLREIRDFLAWHLFEETGHNEMLADFMEGYFKMGRVNEIWPLTDSLLIMKKDRHRYERLQRFKSLNAQGHFVEIAAAAMFRERILPKGNRLNALGLRKHYNVPNKYLTFFDVHRFIDIYHERFGQYLLAKYATTKDLQDQAEKVFIEMVTREYQSEERLYYAMPISKR
ncbi:MAG: iron-containing redox enzyme family protein, partial [Rhabdochlamydiaceae bacterium]